MPENLDFRSSFLSHQLTEEIAVLNPLFDVKLCQELVWAICELTCLRLW